MEWVRNGCSETPYVTSRNQPNGRLQVITVTYNEAGKWLRVDQSLTVKCTTRFIDRGSAKKMGQTTMKLVIHYFPQGADTLDIGNVSEQLLAKGTTCRRPNLIGARR